MESPMLRLEIEHGDRRATAEIPISDVSLEQLEKITLWLSAASDRWEVR